MKEFVQKSLIADTTGSDFLDETIAFWQPFSERPLTREDARQMIERVTRLFGLLAEAKARKEVSEGVRKQAA